jgi:hypothetical protein
MTEQKVRALHFPVEIDAYEARCVNEDCEHGDDGECPTFTVRVCGHCTDEDEEFLTPADYYPCETIRALDDGALTDAPILADVAAERDRQDAKWGAPTDHPDGTGSIALVLYDFPGRTDQVTQFDAASRLSAVFKARTDQRFGLGEGSWADILLEEVFEALAEDDPVKLRAELVQVAAVAVKWCRMIDARSVEEVAA